MKRAIVNPFTGDLQLIGAQTEIQLRPLGLSVGSTVITANTLSDIHSYQITDASNEVFSVQANISGNILTISLNQAIGGVVSIKLIGI